MSQHPTTRSPFNPGHTAQIIRLCDRAILPSGPGPIDRLTADLYPGTATENLSKLRNKIEVAAAWIGRVNPALPKAKERIDGNSPTAKVDAVLCQLWRDIDQILKWPDMRQPDKADGKLARKRAARKAKAKAYREKAKVANRRQ